MARSRLQIKVDLLGGGGVRCRPSPGRIFVVGPGHTFEQFAAAIDDAFARWDLSHLHAFELADERMIGFPDDTFGPEMTWLDHARLKVTREVKPGDVSEYVFDMGDNWQHVCTVLAAKADPVESYGIVPDGPVAIWGWGSIPDHNGRRASDDDGS